MHHSVQFDVEVAEDKYIELCRFKKALELSISPKYLWDPGYSIKAQQSTLGAREEVLKKFNKIMHNYQEKKKGQTDQLRRFRQLEKQHKFRMLSLKLRLLQMIEVIQHIIQIETAQNNQSRFPEL